MNYRAIAARQTTLSRLAAAWRRPNFLVGVILTGGLVAMALLSLAWTPYPIDVIAIPERLQGPSAVHWLGTDQLGRDVASRIMVGARNSIAVGVVAVGIGVFFGVSLGAWAAARGGWIDDLVMRASDVIFAFPAIVSALLITALLGPGAVNAIIAIGIFNVPVFARVTRGAARQIWVSNMFVPGSLSARDRCASLGTMCCRISPRFSSSKAPSSSPWRFWPRPPSATLVSAPSRPIQAGAACCSMPRP